MAPGDLEQLLAEQVTYYRAIAPEYEEHTLPFEGGDELFAALDAFRPTGSVLELTCGRGRSTDSSSATPQTSRRWTRHRR